MHTYSHHHHYHHTTQFLVLFLVMLTSFFSFVKSAGNPAQQLQIGIVTGIAYLIWGIFHHVYDHDLNWKVVVEYSAISIFGITVLWMMLRLIT